MKNTRSVFIYVAKSILALLKIMFVVRLSSSVQAIKNIAFVLEQLKVKKFKSFHFLKAHDTCLAVDIMW